MAADSRSTHTDALATLGTILQPGEKRDAIHLGVDPVVAGRNLVRGAHVGFGPDGKAYVADKNIKAVGIVDPFLTDVVLEGQSFWLIVYPRQITSLRHVWEHPDFPDSGETGGGELMKNQFTSTDPEAEHQMRVVLGDPVAVAKETIRSIAKNMGVSYEDLMEHANDYQERGEYWVEGGRFEGESVHPETFWPAYELVTGKEAKEKYNFLSCSC